MTNIPDDMAREMDGLERKDFVRKLSDIVDRHSALPANVEQSDGRPADLTPPALASRDLVVPDHEAKLVKAFLDDKRGGNRWSYQQKPFSVCFTEELFAQCLKYPDIEGASEGGKESEFSLARRQLINDLERALTFAASPNDVPMHVSNLERDIHTGLLQILRMLASDKPGVVTPAHRLAAHEELELQRTWNANQSSLATA